MITGSLFQTLKLQTLENKWQQRKADHMAKLRTNDGSVSVEEKNRINFQMQIDDDNYNKQKNEYMKAAYEKLQKGEPLTPEERRYIEQHNPGALRKYEEIKAEKEQFKEDLKECKTKEEVNNLHSMHMVQDVAAAKKVDSNPNLDIATKKALMEEIQAKAKAISDVVIEFKKSPEYGDMPTEAEVARAENDDRQAKMDEFVAEVQDNELLESGEIEDVAEAPDINQNPEPVKTKDSVDTKEKLDDIKSRQNNQVDVKEPVKTDDELEHIDVSI